MNISSENYTPQDYDKVIAFFRELYSTSGDLPYWLPQRFEYTEFFVSYLNKYRGVEPDWKETIYLYQDETGKLVGLVCSENPDENMFLFALPGYKYLEKDMIVKAEQTVRDILKRSEIKIWCDDTDLIRIADLEKSGYKKCDAEVEYLNWMDLTRSIPEFKMPDGYTLHDMTDETNLDLQQKIDKITAAFDSETYPVPIYRNLQSGPSYRKDLDLYATGQDGTIATFCFVWADEELNIGYFEPVGTDARHRRKGLGRAILNVGLQRLKQAGVAKAFVGSYGDERMAFYDASGFTNRITLHPWLKYIV